jgi:hypothetical protein
VIGLVELPYKLIAPEPVGPVDYALIRELVAGEWTVTGALWLHDGVSIGFDPAPGYAGTDRARYWYDLLRRCWEMGAEPAKVFRYWGRYCNMYTLCNGPVESADSLDDLRRHLGW